MEVTHWFNINQLQSGMSTTDKLLWMTLTCIAAHCLCKHYLDKLFNAYGVSYYKRRILITSLCVNITSIIIYVTLNYSTKNWNVLFCLSITISSAFTLYDASLVHALRNALLLMSFSLWILRPAVKTTLYSLIMNVCLAQIISETNKIIFAISSTKNKWICWFVLSFEQYPNALLIYKLTQSIRHACDTLILDLITKTLICSYVTLVVKYSLFVRMYKHYSHMNWFTKQDCDGQLLNCIILQDDYEQIALNRAEFYAERLRKFHKLGGAVEIERDTRVTRAKMLQTMKVLMLLEKKKRRIVERRYANGASSSTR